MPVPPAFITVPIRPCWTLGRRYQDKRYPRPRRGNTDREFLNDLATEGSPQRNCNVNLDELRSGRPDLDCEPQQAGASLAIFNWTRQLVLSRPVELYEVQTYLATDRAKPRVSTRVAVY